MDRKSHGYASGADEQSPGIEYSIFRLSRAYYVQNRPSSGTVSIGL